MKKLLSGICSLVVFLAVLIFVIAVPAQGQGGNRFDRNKWLQDYAVLKQALEKQYSNLAWFASAESGVNLPFLNRRTLAALTEAETDEEARSALLNFVTNFHDGHFSQLAPVVSSDKEKRKALGPPIYVREDAAGGCAAQGFAPPERASYSLPFESLPAFHLETDGVKQPFRSGVLTADNHQKVGLVRIASFETTDYPALCLRAWTQEVWDEEGKLIQKTLDRTIEKSWYATLAGVLKQFKQEGVAAVIVDVGNNPGGDDSGDISARLFTAKPQLHSAPLLMSQDQSVSVQYFDEELKDLQRALQLSQQTRFKPIVEQLISNWKKQRDKLSSTKCPMSWVWQEQRSWQTNSCLRLVEAGSAGGPLAYRAHDTLASIDIVRLLHWPARVMPLWGTWTGPLYVITNDKTSSSAEMFAAVLQDNHAAKTVGVTTKGSGCGFMTDSGPVELPNSHLRFRIPNCVRLREDGTDAVAGIKPDIPVLVTEGESDRQRAQRVVDDIASDADPH